MHTDHKHDNRIYSPETANDYYEELADALSSVPDYADVYRSLGRIFKRMLNENTMYERIKFGGAFAQTDYLLKKCNAPLGLQKMVNDMRTRLKRFEDRQAQQRELCDNCTADVEALCRFIAMVYGVAVPVEMAKRFPQRKTTATKRLLTEEVRFMVDSWDDKFIYGHLDGYGETKVCYAEGFDNYPYNWTYIARLLYRHAQLNIVRPREKDGAIYPEIIVLEPDYLVDATSIAGCFEDYGRSPLNHLINKISPVVNTPQIALGNFAGQLLDEAIRHDNATYAESARRFFANNAMSLLSTDIPATFNDQAKAQLEHIRNVFEELESKKVVGGFNRNDIILEPSFFCPTLGIQGRMDLLQLDYRLLMEQKSGKSAFPEPRKLDESPKAMTKHYVQMLLYMSLIRYNFRGDYERNRHELNAFLLYSKYEKSLCGLGFAPRLFFEAMKLRNRIVRYDFFYATGGYRLLDNLTAEKLNENGVHGRLWEQWQKPRIESVLSTIHNASELERAYYYRFLTFVGNEQIMSKMGNKRNDCSGFASTWLEPIESKLQAGNIYDRLSLTRPAADHVGKVEQVELAFKENRNNDMSNFRKGDIVVLYPYRPESVPNAAKTMVIRCAIEDITASSITLRLRAAQSDNRLFNHYSDHLWAIEHDYVEASHTSRFKAMQAFLAAPKARRDLLLMQRRPTVDHSVCLSADYGQFNDLALRVKRAKELFLIIGPPGTGKTSFGMLNTLKEELLQPDSRVLLVSYTNRAVDEMCSKLIEEGIDFLRLGKRLSTTEEIAPHLIETLVDECGNIAELKSRVNATRVVAGTTTTLNSCLPFLSQSNFSLAIIDEASQILEPDIIGILSSTTKQQPSISKFVFIGDHKQLPAVVQQNDEESRVDDPRLNAIGLTNCRLSLFERLLTRYRNDPDVAFMLTKQGRMHRDIASFPNKAFYNDKLDVVPKAHQIAPLPPQGEGNNGIDDLIATRRMAFVSVPQPTKEAYVSDKVNVAEAEVIAAIVGSIYKANADNFDTERAIGVIVPYRNQIATIRNLIDQTLATPLLHDIAIDTVERFQGSQRDFIIYGFTVQKYYQLDFLTSNSFEEDGEIIDRKLNVAMTRARKHLIMVGNEALLNNNHTFKRLIDFAKSQHSFFNVPVPNFVHGNFNVAPIDD